MVNSHFIPVIVSEDIPEKTLIILAIHMKWIEDELNNRPREFKLFTMKNGILKKIILHSFAHLSESKADPEFTKLLLDRTEERLANTGYTVKQTPFGYFLDLKVDAPGFSLARVFKNI